MGKSIRNFAVVTRVGLDLAKNAFQVHAGDAKGETVVARKLTLGRLLAFFAEIWRRAPRPTIGRGRWLNSGTRSC
jgi:hypothetical protein